MTIPLVSSPETRSESNPPMPAGESEMGPESLSGPADINQPQLSGGNHGGTADAVTHEGETATGHPSPDAVAQRETPVPAGASLTGEAPDGGQVGESDFAERWEVDCGCDFALSSL